MEKIAAAHLTHYAKSVSTLMQVGAGGGGLTQSAYEAARIAANPEKYFPDNMMQATRSLN